MGQRLNIEIIENDEVIANAYYHWSGYTSSALNLTNTILENDVLYDDKILNAIKLLELTGAHLTSLEVEHLDKELKMMNFSIAQSRNEGLISISKEGINETRYWEEARVEIHVDKRCLKFDLCWTLDRDDYTDGELDEAEEFELADLLLNQCSFDDFKSLHTSVLSLINNKKYYFKHKENFYSFIE